MTLYLGDCLTVLDTLDANSIHAVVCDPPYNLSFMGKAWDGTGIAFQPETWAKVLRVMRPGAFLLSFGGTRTYHRMVCAIEDAGFVVRDTLCWLYGSGFPKSHNVSKQIDKAAGAEREVIGTKIGLPGYSLAPDKGRTTYNAGGRRSDVECAVTAPATDAAREWEGFGTALKPAYEPIVLAQKPLDGTYAENVAKWNCGVLNIDRARIGTGRIESGRMGRQECESIALNRGLQATGERQYSAGRWPANVILDEHAAAMLDEASGERKPRPSARALSGEDWIDRSNRTTYGTYKGRYATIGYADTTSNVSRFFYVAKASRAERTANGTVPGIHPTVKPIALMRHLLTLVVPPGGVVLDPFAGSGSTLVAAVELGMDWIGIELDADYHAIAAARILDAELRIEAERAIPLLTWMER